MVIKLFVRDYRKRKHSYLVLNERTTLQMKTHYVSRMETELHSVSSLCEQNREYSILLLAISIADDILKCCVPHISITPQRQLVIRAVMEREHPKLRSQVCEGWQSISAGEDSNFKTEHSGSMVIETSKSTIALSSKSHL